MRFALLIVLAAVCSGVAGCSEAGKSASPATQPATQPRAAGRLRPPDDGTSFSLRQRATAPLPGSDGRIRLTIDDITAGQVMVAIADERGQSILATTSASAGDEVRFQVDGEDFTLHVIALKNSLVGEDEAEFRVARAAAAVAAAASGADSAPATAPALTEEQKIEQLINAVANLQGATFIRNGQEHSGADAAEHMRRKWNAGKDRIKTAEQFIDHAASRSSLSGQPYQIRLADGTTVESGEYLKKKLKELEGGQ